MTDLNFGVDVHATGAKNTVAPVGDMIALIATSVRTELMAQSPALFHLASGQTKETFVVNTPLEGVFIHATISINRESDRESLFRIFTSGIARMFSDGIALIAEGERELREVRASLDARSRRRSNWWGELLAKLSRRR